MRNFYIILFLVFTTTISAQETEEVIINDDTKVNIEDTNEVPFAVIENVPVYRDCNQKLSNAELKQCMSDKINRHVVKNFNTKLGSSLGLPDGIVRIHVVFKIDTEGKVIDILTRAPHPELEKEAKRVISLLPDMKKPGIQRGKPVIVPYALPIVFAIDNSSKKKNKKQRKQLKRTN
ncbi:hypothetical protein [Psychroserpens sp. Hel_I_66]|uniref:hypothetical protein n=1 Tax=Psychroserpens sp. Hel_I_66 TaxID=1250004 RepID=UPI00068D73F6|nr:hypothetical protein [Psychroserpens sp. Hel_I_66]